MKISSGFNLSLCGIFGHKIDYTLSPLIHNSIAKLLDINLCYGKFDVSPELFPAAVKGFKAMGMKGANVTQPYKTEVLKYLDCLDGEAETVGAVNTINRESDGFYRGYNTDITGFINAVNYEFNEAISGKTVILLGAGGAARAVLYALIKSNAKYVLIINRSFSNAEKLKKEADLWKKSLNSFTEIIYTDFKLTRVSEKTDIAFIEDCGILINTVTPSDGNKNFAGGLFNRLNFIKNNFFLMDISYSEKSSFISSVLEEKCLKFANGLSMLLFQAIESFYIWTGRRIEFNYIKDFLSGIF